MKNEPATHCEGMRCSIRDNCARHSLDELQRRLAADYSQVVSFKREKPSECKMRKGRRYAEAED